MSDRTKTQKALASRAAERRQTPWLALGIALGIALGAASGELAWGTGAGAAMGLALQHWYGRSGSRGGV